jgi:signal transduction histidine kinase
MRPKLTVTRRITLTILLSMLGSGLLVMLFSFVFSAVFSRVSGEKKPASDSNIFVVSAMLAEDYQDTAQRERLLGLVRRHYPHHDLAVYTAAGELVATTMTEPFAPLEPRQTAADAPVAVEVGPRGGQKIEYLPIIVPSGARFYALHGLEDKPTPAALAWWFWLSCAIPIVCSVVASLLLARSITRPLDRILVTSRALAGGQLSARVGLDRRDELGLLASTLDHMAGRLTALLQARTELLALVSHELRTPLARIRVALDIAADRDASHTRRALANISVDLSELERLLGDTFAYSRLELVDKAGEGTPLNLEEVDPAPLLEEAAHRFGQSWTDRQLSLDLEPELPLLDADRVLLLRVVLNLLENAAKYSPADQPIVLRASKASDRLLLEVIDRGEGIDEPDLARAFEPFFRARTAQHQATSGGLGLGLTLCRRVVEAHGGTIEARSSLHQGTTMALRLPAAIDHAETQDKAWPSRG